jgi:hypothetical protein
VLVKALTARISDRPNNAPPENVENFMILLLFVNFN